MKNKVHGTGWGVAFLPGICLALLLPAGDLTSLCSVPHLYRGARKSIVPCGGCEQCIDMGHKGLHLD